MGVSLLFLVVYFSVSLLCAFIGMEMARSRNKDPAMWGLICFLFGLIGIIILAMSGGSVPQTQQSYTALPDQPPKDTPVAPSASAADTAAWKALTEFDEEVKRAVQNISGFGRSAEERLATAYLAVKDKNLLPAIVGKIIADESDAGSKRAEQKARAAQQRTTEASSRLERREKLALETIEEIKKAGMTYNGKKVISAALNETNVDAELGWAKIVYVDGSAELRSGTNFQIISFARS